MKQIIIFFISNAILTLSFAQEIKHFINDANYRTETQKQFEARKELFKNREEALLSIFNKPLSMEQKEALQFLYAYMPLSDLADYDGAFFLKQVNIALEARNTFSWCKTVPESIFRHFVLPFRVNNEDLDTARVIFFRELKDRIQNLSMREAALEVNHWCHEKVNYTACDIRTSSPLATVKTSWGRCGEESTFTVAAMRAVGIPARQVYTPRWAHTDDNHAWVEIFVDGRWYYLGACEPEPVLNKGWFDKPVKRAMMVHTRVFGKYKDETTNNLEENLLFTKINTLKNYTKTKKLTVKTVDKNQKAVADATVRFGIYNYAEFYPMATLQSNAKGLVTITTGLGDLLISASRNDSYGEIKSVGTNTDTIILTLKKIPFKKAQDTIEIIPPVALQIEEVSSSAKEENDKRLSKEDSIRNAYRATFMQPNKAKNLAISLNLDTVKISRFIQKSEGNWNEIAKFITKNTNDSRVLDFLEIISEKDLRDVSEITLTTQLKATKPHENYPYEIYKNNILNPRLQNEFLRPWKPFLQAKFSEEFKEKAQKNIQIILNWMAENITTNDAENYANCPISPIGTYNLKTTDKQGRNLFFVALCRSFHIPARINKTTYQPQYYKNGKWLNISFESTKKVNNTTAELTLKNNDKNPVKPEYYIHFTLQYFKEGRFQTLDYEYSNIFNKYPTTLQLNPGYYCLMTGHRDDNGNIRILRKFFTMKKEEKLTETITLLPLEKIVNIKGNLNTDISFTDTKKQTHNLATILEKKGVIFAILEPTREPTRHVMVDIPLLKKEFDTQEVPFIFIIPKNKFTTDFSIENYKGLPKNSIFVIDTENTLTDSLLKATNLSENSFYPIVLFSNEKGKITFLSTGYRIGIGESLLKQMQ